MLDRTVAVPIHSRSGVVAHAIIDATDEAIVASYRWRLHTKGYAITYVGLPGGRSGSLLMHRLILGLSGEQVTDHLNRDKLDNRRANLRPATTAENNQNLTVRTKAASGYRGVTRSVYKSGSVAWQVRVWGHGKRHNGGVFRDVHEAGRVAAEMRARLMPHSEEGRQARAERA